MRFPKAGSRVRARGYRNTAEQAFAVAAEREGWDVSKRGWPDFWAERTRPDGTVEFALVEVKPAEGRNLRPAQAQLFAHLAAAGIACYVVRGPGGTWEKFAPPRP